MMNQTNIDQIKRLKNQEIEEKKSRINQKYRTAEARRSNQ